MRHYRANDTEAVAQAGYTDLFIVYYTDMSAGFSDKQIILGALAVGDVVELQMIQAHRTLVTGPTGAPTASVGITGAGTQFTAASVVKSGSQYIAPGAGVAAYAVNTATNLILDLQAGGGDGAAATAGEIWIWAKINRASRRLIQA